MTDHTGKSLADIVLQTMKEFDIPINDIYLLTVVVSPTTKAANMAGQYAGVQTRVKEVNRLAEFEPCCANSLNLVASVAAEYCLMVVSYFQFLQKVYNLFAGSTHRWSLLLFTISTKSLVVKSMLYIRWSARADATKALILSYAEIHQALTSFSHICDEPVVAKLEAE